MCYIKSRFIINIKTSNIFVTFVQYKHQVELVHHKEYGKSMYTTSIL